MADQAYDLHAPALLAFWSEYRLCTLTTLRTDGSPHVVPIGATLDPDSRLLRIITNDGSAKVRHVEGDPRVSVCQVERGRWSTIEGAGRVSRDPDEIAESVRRYAERYRQPRVNPNRVTILIDITRVLGNAAR